MSALNLSEGALDERHALSLLVVDDEPDVRTLLATSLVAIDGCAVATAGSAKEALRLIDEAAAPFDGLFLDIQMPGTTGIDLCAVIRRIPGYQNVPIIMLTAMTEQHFMHRAFANGANDYISKPFEFEDIRSKMAREQLIGRNRNHLKDVRNGGSSSAKEVIRSLDDAVTIPVAERFVTRDAFQNYILQTTRRHDAPLTIRATKIAGVYEIFSRLPSGEYQKIVQEIGRIMSRLTTRSGDVMTHLGNGIFLSAYVRKSTLSIQTLSDALEKSAAFDSLADHELSMRVILGNEHALTARNNADVIFALTKAIESVETAEESMSGWGSFREWLSIRRSIGQERSRMDRTAYKQILNDFMEEGELNWRKRDRASEN